MHERERRRVRPSSDRFPGGRSRRRILEFDADGRREPEQIDEEAPQLKGPREALRVATQRNFGPYFVGNALSASGTWFQNLAASLLVFRLTRSPFLLGVLNFCAVHPVLVLAPWAGRRAPTVRPASACCS